VLQEKLDEVENRIRKAAAKAGRRRDEITLVAVTKKFPASVIAQAYAHGLREFGENYVQEFETKSAECSVLDGARFHLIGHLQSNKTAKAIELFQVIQTVDTAKLARRLGESVPNRAATNSAATNRAATVRERSLEVMIEVKLSEEQSKAGAPPERLLDLIDAIRQYPNLSLTGLMTMPPWSDDAEVSRPYFVRLRELAGQHGLAGLSMGMSHDLEVAIEEGATLVRVGTALFGLRPKA
jgi:PLP dependent protein